MVEPKVSLIGKGSSRGLSSRLTMKHQSSTLNSMFFFLEGAKTKNFQSYRHYNYESPTIG